MQVYLSDDIEKKLDMYRLRRKEERGGKMIQRHRAVQEILESVLNNEPNIETITLRDLAARVTQLEVHVNFIRNP